MINKIYRDRIDGLLNKCFKLWYLITEDNKKISEDRINEIERRIIFDNLYLKEKYVISEENFDKIAEENDLEKVAEVLLISLRYCFELIKEINYYENINDVNKRIEEIEKKLSLITFIYYQKFC